METSFMAAIDKFSMELRTLFPRGAPVTSTDIQVSGHGPYAQPKSWGQSRPMRIDPGPTCPVKTTRGPLHALAVALGQSHPRNSAAQQTGSVRTLGSIPIISFIRIITATHSKLCLIFYFIFVRVFFSLLGFSPPLRCDRRNGTVHTPRSNSGRAYGTNRPNDNGRTPHPGGPSTKAAERWTTKPAASRSPGGGPCPRTPTRGCSANDRGRLGPEAARSAEIHQANT
ncbi:unnamed protein product [Prunus brigantina]